MLALAPLVRVAAAWAAANAPPLPDPPAPVGEAAAQTVVAEPPTLVWDADPPCPEASVVRARVEALIGRPLRDEGEPVHAVAVVDTRGPQPRLQLRLRSETGVSDRLITASACTELAEITAVMVAVAIDPSLPEPTPVPEPEPAAPPDETPAPVVAPPPAAPAPAAEPRLSGLVRASAGIGFGAVPGIAPTVGGLAGLRWPHARLEIGAEHWLVQEARFAGARSVGVDVRLTTGHASGCWVPGVATARSRRVEFPLCAGAAIGSLRGDGVGVPRRTKKRLLWASGHVAAAVLFVPIRQLAFGLDARLVVPFSRSHFTLDDYGVIHRTAVAGVVVSGVVEGRFP